MNENILIQCGFEKEVELVRNGICPFCKTNIDKLSFKDKLSLKEYFISGLCQNCQDEVFKDNA